MVMLFTLREERVAKTGCRVLHGITEYYGGSKEDAHVSLLLQWWCVSWC